MKTSKRYIQDTDNKICIGVDLREELGVVLVAASFVHKNDQYRKKTGAAICDTRIKSHLEGRNSMFVEKFPAKNFADNEGVLRPYPKIAEIYRAILDKHKDLFNTEINKSSLWSDLISEVGHLHVHC